MSPSSQTMSSPRMQQQQHRRRGQRHNLPGAAMGTLPPCCIPAGLFLVLWITVTLQIATAIVGLHYSLVVVQQSPRYFTYKQSRLKSSFLVGVEAFVVDQPYRYNRRMVVQFHSRVLKSKRRAMKSSVSPGSDSRSTFVFGKVQGESRESDVKRSLGATQDHINKISALHPYVDVSRRAFWSFILCCCATSHPVFTASALDGNEAVYVSGESDFVRTGKGGFGYTFTPPPNFVQSKKPLQTHLDEINFEKKAGDTKINGYVYGITVDPVRIDNLRQVRVAVRFLERK